MMTACNVLSLHKHQHLKYLFAKISCMINCLKILSVVSQEAAWSVTDECIQIMGGMGFMAVSLLFHLQMNLH